MFIGYGGSPALVAGVLKRARQAAVCAGGDDTGSADDEFLARVCGGSAAGDLRGMSARRVPTSKNLENLPLRTYLQEPTHTESGKLYRKVKTSKPAKPSNLPRGFQRFGFVHPFRPGGVHNFGVMVRFTYG